MKTSKVADMLGVDQKTILNWTERSEFSQFFSDDAKGTGRSMGHDYSETEIIVLNTIRTERQKNTAWDDIARMLERGIRDTELPASALLVSSPAPIVQYGKMQQLQVQLDLSEKENAQLREDIVKLREEYQLFQQRKNAEIERVLHERQAEIERLFQEKHDEAERLLREATRREGELREQIGKWQAMYEMSKGKAQDDQ